MKSYETRVKSYFRNRDTRFFEEDNSKISHEGQLKRFRESFAASNGENATIDFESIGDTRIDYEGQLTLVSSANTGHFLTNYCSGPEVSIIKYPTAVSEFRSGLTDKGKIDNAAFCLSISGYNFHCFVFEILPALIQFQEEINSAEVLLLGATEGGSFIGEFNQLLNLHHSIQLLPLRSSVEITEAYAVTSFPFRIYPIDILEGIRLQVTQASERISDTKGTDVCFIGRADRDRNRRKLLNEDAVLKEFDDFFGDVIVVRPGITELVETVAQVRDARVLIGLLGGSLAHLIWAWTLELFIEIVPYSYFGATETEELSKIYGFEYRRITSNNIGADSWSWADQECDLNELRATLKDIGLNFNR